MKQVTTKGGRILTGRGYELYTGECPPERPCTPEQVEKYRAYFDGLPPIQRPKPCNCGKPSEQKNQDSIRRALPKKK